MSARGVSEKQLERLFRRYPYLLSRSYQPHQLVTAIPQFKTGVGRYSATTGFVDLLIQPRDLTLHVIELKKTELVLADLEKQLLPYLRFLRSIPEFANNSFKGILVGQCPRNLKELKVAAKRHAASVGHSISIKIIGQGVPWPQSVVICPVCNSAYHRKREDVRRRDRYRCTDGCFRKSGGEMKSYLGKSYASV